MMKTAIHVGVILLFLGTVSFGLAREEEWVEEIEAHYAKQLDDLRSRLIKEIPFVPARAKTLWK